MQYLSFSEARENYKRHLYQRCVPLEIRRSSKEADDPSKERLDQFWEEYLAGKYEKPFPTTVAHILLEKL